MSTGGVLRAVFLRPWLAAWRQPADGLWHALFFVVVASLFPLSMRPEPATLALLAPGVLWVGALLAVLLACARLFQDELAQGWVDQWLLTCARTGLPLSLLVAARLAAQWALTALPVLAVAPLVAVQFGLGGAALGVLLAALALGTAALVLITGVAAALAGGVRGAALLVMLIVLPLVTPALVFGSMAVHAAMRGASPVAELALLGAMLAVLALVCPLLAAAGLKAAAEH
ncbi:heme exporter protein CcmB [Comamonadaceae bacterium OH2545_COT-014]|nr:heme exporter protein CcmB [Comamonadaceae bacterium OH2545_COT-014]